MNLTRGINLRKIAELMPGASGAEVKVRVKWKYLFHFVDALFQNFVATLQIKRDKTSGCIYHPVGVDKVAPQCHLEHF